MVKALQRIVLAGILGFAGFGSGISSGQSPVPAPADSSTGDDTPSLPRFRVVEPTRSSADSMTLREIIDRSVEGEKRKLAGHRDMTYTMTVRTILTWKKKREIRDEIIRVYQDDRGLEKRVHLLEKVQKFRRGDDGWEESDENDDEGRVEVEAEETGRGENLARVPFFLRNQEDFEFTLHRRTLEDDHVIFKIGFKPRSSFKPLPSGTVYVDTDEFRVIHEEFSFEENPMPLLLKDVRRFSRQWTRLPGGEWVVSRISGDLTLQGSWTGVIPQGVEVGVQFTDYAFDQGYNSRVFGPRGERR